MNHLVSSIVGFVGSQKGHSNNFNQMIGKVLIINIGMYQIMFCFFVCYVNLYFNERISKQSTSSNTLS